MGDLVKLMMPMTDGLLGWFAETTLVASALAALAALVARVRGLAPGPAARHALWLLVLLKLVTPPLIHWPWSVPLPVAAHTSSERPSATAVVGSSLVLADEATLDEPPPVAVPRAAGPAREESNGPPGAVVASRHHQSVPGWDWRELGAWVALSWLGVTVVLAAQQGRRVLRFRRLLVEATPAPGWLIAEAAALGERLAVRVPAILVVPGLATPVLWCLGRPVLLVPAQLLKTLEAGRWRSIVAHELAHLRRGDHWVRRLELLAGLAWWWNPVYWLARSRLDFEAELACDAWAVWAAPADRLTYAESLIRICTSLAPADPPAPALGVAGTGRSFERRLTMILRDRVDHRVSARGLLAATLLAALALPSWTLAKPAPVEPDQPTKATVAEPATGRPVEVFLRDDDDEATAQDAKQEAAKLAKLKAELDQSQQKLSEPDKKMQEKLGPDSDFAKKMEAFGKEMEGKFGPGSDFAKQMEALGKEMEAKFGPGSDFAKEMEKNFGPDSGFAEKMVETMKDAQADDAKAKLAKLKAEADKASSKARDEANKARTEANKARTEARNKARDEATKARTEANNSPVKGEVKSKVEGRGKVKPTPSKQARRIEQLESRIEEMMAELKQLKAESLPEEDEDGQR